MNSPYFYFFKKNNKNRFTDELYEDLLLKDGTKYDWFILKIATPPIVKACTGNQAGYCKSSHFPLVRSDLFIYLFVYLNFVTEGGPPSYPWGSHNHLFWFFP